VALQGARRPADRPAASARLQRPAEPDPADPAAQPVCRAVAGERPEDSGGQEHDQLQLAGRREDSPGDHQCLSGHDRQHGVDGHEQQHDEVGASRGSGQIVQISQFDQGA